MELVKIMFLLHFSLVTFTNGIATTNELKVKYSITSFKNCLQSDRVLTTIIQISLSECVDECAFRTDCRAVNYFSRHHSCEILPGDEGIMLDNAKRARPCIFVRRTDMDMSKVNGKCPCGAGELYDLEADNSCTITECESFTIRNGQVNGNMRSVGASITYTCDQMYIATFEEPEATCLANGSWTYKPDCIKDTDGRDICSGCVLPRDCRDIKIVNETAETGVFEINPTGSESYKVRCDMETPPGGWTVFQRRESNSDFEKDWQAYKEGFGDLDYNFWLGNDKIWALTSSGQFKLRVDLRDRNGTEGYAEYNSFSIGNESTKYILNIAGHSGTATDSLVRRHNGMMFSTVDQDNDTHNMSCANRYKGGWWYCDCQSSNLNGPYGNVKKNHGMTWKIWRNDDEFMKFTEMKIYRNQ